jgi:peroxin-13
MISVAEQFGNLRDALSSIFSIRAIMRRIRVFIAKLRGKPAPPEEEEEVDNDDTAADPQTPSRKPLIIFLLTFFALPYLLDKFWLAVASLQSQRQPLARHFISPEYFRATYDYTPRKPATELALRKGDLVVVLHRGEVGWSRARLQDGREGYVPTTYLTPLQAPQQPPPPRPVNALTEEFTAVNNDTKT